MRDDLVRSVVTLLVCAGTVMAGGCGGGGGGSSTAGATTPGGPPSGPSASYAVSGTVSGLDSGEAVTLLDNGADATIVSGNGGFTFPTQLAAGSAYAVSVQSHTPGIACSVGQGSGTIGTSDVTGIAVTCAAGTETILYSFAAGASGATPMAGLVRDAAGNLFGTTQQGGNGDGTVFELSAGGVETVLHAFGATAGDGQRPQTAPVLDGAGNLYGTTPAGGANGDGTVFKVSPNGVETVLHSFGATASDGQNPYGGLVIDSAGNLYGTTQKGGAYGAGTVFELTAAGAEAVLYSFHALGVGVDGQNPQGDLIMDSAGNLYGTTPYGGANLAGMVFELGANGAESILYSFRGPTADGATPFAGLARDSAGNLYGTTTYGGAYGSGLNDGTAFVLNASGTETALYSFGSAAGDGVNPRAALVADSAGNLYGTTSQGGANGTGTIFELSAGGAERTLYSFGGPGSADGNYPLGALIVDGAGNLYGTTEQGGTDNAGTVFEIN